MKLCFEIDFSFFTNSHVYYRMLDMGTYQKFVKYIKSDDRYQGSVDEHSCGRKFITEVFLRSLVVLTHCQFTKDRLTFPTVTFSEVPKQLSTELEDTETGEFSRVLRVTIERNPGQSLGISIVGGNEEALSKGIHGIFVRTIVENSPAASSNGLKVNDRILEVKKFCSCLVYAT